MPSPFFDFRATVNFWDAVVVGFFMALYTGLVGARIFAFYQARHGAVAWLHRLPHVINREHETPFNYGRDIADSTLPHIIELKSLGHDRASLAIVEIMYRFIDGAALRCGIIPIENFVPQQLPSSPPPPGLMRLITLDAIQHLSGNVHQYAAQIATLKPNFWPLLNPWPFPNYLTHNGIMIGLRVQRRAWIAIVFERFADALAEELVCIAQYISGRDGVFCPGCAEVKGKCKCRRRVEAMKN